MEGLHEKEYNRRKTEREREIGESFNKRDLDKGEGG